jgi:hypothetical protein
MGEQTVLATGPDEVVLALVDDIRTRFEAADVSATAALYRSFDDHAALGAAIVEAASETTGTDRSFEDGVRRSWSPTQSEEFPFARLLTEYEAVFWSVRRDLLQSHAGLIRNLPPAIVGDFLASLDRQVRREILAHIQAVPPSMPSLTRTA